MDANLILPVPLVYYASITGDDSGLKFNRRKLKNNFIHQANHLSKKQTVCVNICLPKSRDINDLRGGGAPWGTTLELFSAT